MEQDDLALVHTKQRSGNARGQSTADFPNAGAYMVDKRQTQWPTELNGHDVDPNNSSFKFRQCLQPVAHRLSPRFRAKENCGQFPEGHTMTVSFLIHMPSTNRPLTKTQGRNYFSGVSQPFDRREVGTAGIARPPAE